MRLLAGIRRAGPVAAVVVAGIRVVRHFWHAGEPRVGGGSRQARAILDDRYARGEIDRVDDVRRRADLVDGKGG